MYGFYPHDGDMLIRNEVSSFLSRKTLFVRMPESVRRWLTPEKTKFRYVNAANLAKELCSGRSNDAIASFVWGKRFCIVACDEWFVDPLSRIQKYHIAYLLEMMDALIGKIGLSTMMNHVIRLY